MSLQPSTRLGPYEIISAIGAGGMGEVYKARDTRLERIVVIKVVPESVSGDPSALERFQREARAASALNHPNICTVYDIGEWEGRPFLALEYLEGETLRQRIAGKPLKVDELLELGIQIADAGCGALEGHCPSRYQASQYLRRGSRSSQGHGFRSGEIGGGTLCAGSCRTANRDRHHRNLRGDAHQSRYSARNRGLYVARAGPRRRTGRLHGSVFVRPGALRDGYGTAGVCGKYFGSHLHRPAHEGTDSGAATQPRVAGQAGRNHREGS